MKDSGPMINPFASPGRSASSPVMMYPSGFWRTSINHNGNKGGKMKRIGLAKGMLQDDG
jgi:hypothetical protein